MIDHDGLQLGVDVQRFGARLAEAVAGILDAAKRHVRTGAVGRAVDRHQAALIARDEFLRAMQARGVNRAGQAVMRAVGQRARPRRNPLTRYRHVTGPNSSCCDTSSSGDTFSSTVGCM